MLGFALLGAIPAAQASSCAAPAVQINQDPADLQENGREVLSIFRAPLLREGSYLVEAGARLQRDATRNEWKIVVDQSNASVANYEFIVLPCTRLAEMQRIVETTPNQQVKFQVTGRVLVFRNRNYLLPTHAPVMAEKFQPTALAPPAVRASEAGGPAAEASAPKGAMTQASSQPTSAPAKTESAQDIANKLEEAAGPLMHSTTAGASSDVQKDADAGQSDSMRGSDLRDETPRPVQAQGSASRRREFGGGGSANSAERLLAENSQVAGRRGKLTRDGNGGWLFVFDADASGLADPPLRLLPCLLLERIEEYARRTGNNSPALMSGAVYVYGGQNYLLPMVFRIPQDRRNLTP